MSFKRLIEISDERIREEIGDYYFISKDRMNELIHNFQDGSKRISELTKIIDGQQMQIRDLQLQLVNKE